MFTFAPLYMHRKQQMTMRTFFGSKQNSVRRSYTKGRWEKYAICSRFCRKYLIKNRHRRSKKVRNMQWIYPGNWAHVQRQASPVPPSLTSQQQIIQHWTYLVPLTMCTTPIQPIEEILVRHFPALHFWRVSLYSDSWPRKTCHKVIECIQ